MSATRSAVRSAALIVALPAVIGFGPAAPPVSPVVDAVLTIEVLDVDGLPVEGATVFARVEETRDDGRSWSGRVEIRDRELTEVFLE